MALKAGHLVDCAAVDQMKDVTQASQLQIINESYLVPLSKYNSMIIDLS